jgi:hypothetical protein
LARTLKRRLGIHALPRAGGALGHADYNRGSCVAARSHQSGADDHAQEQPSSSSCHQSCADDNYSSSPAVLVERSSSDKRELVYIDEEFLTRGTYQNYM